MDLILLIGLLLSIGIVAETIGQHVKIPRVTVLIVCGVLLGPEVLAWIPESTSETFEFLTVIALTMIGFLLGGRLLSQPLERMGRATLIYSLVITVVTGLVVAVGLLALGFPLPVALVLSGVALATDPLATVDVIRTLGNTGVLARMLEGIVALDDVWGLVLFSVLMSLASALSADFTWHYLMHGAWELFASVALGIGLGLPGGWISGRLKEGEPTLLEALALVFLCAGLSRHFELNYLLSAIAMGAAVTVSSTHHERAFHEIEIIEWPFLVMFLLLTGASFSFAEFDGTWMLVLAYMGLRIVGRWLGGWVPAELGMLTRRERSYAGLCLLPQAGVALGVALLGCQTFPEHTSAIIGTAVMATILFEIIGPPMTSWGLTKLEAEKR